MTTNALEGGDMKGLIRAHCLNLFFLTMVALLSGVRERPSNGSYARNPTWCALQSPRRGSGIC